MNISTVGQQQALPTSVLQPRVDGAEQKTKPGNTTDAAAATGSVTGAQAGSASSTSTNQPVVDKVTISSAGQAALKELTETAAQTAQEAMHGDRQAVKLEAKLAAQHSAQHPQTKPT